MTKDPDPQPPVVTPELGDGSTASPGTSPGEGHDLAGRKPAERRSFEDAIGADTEPYEGGPAGQDGDDDPDDRGAAYSPDAGDDRTPGPSSS